MAEEKSNVRPIRPDIDVEGKRRVLVVEDNLDTVHSTMALLRAMGHEVDFAINGLAAIDVS
jgi:CheY-like chemotaxis protein